MKKISLMLGIMLFFGIGANAQGILGYWFNDVKDAKVQIYESGGKYYGKIVWLKEPNRDGKPKTDHKNANPNLRSRPTMGIVLLNDFVKNGEKFDSGTIYDPKNGKTYSCKITPDGPNKLNIRGFIGISLIGRTTVWTRTTAPEAN